MNESTKKLIVGIVLLLIALLIAYYFVGFTFDYDVGPLFRL